MSQIRSSHYIEVQPERDVSADNFPKGQINLNWTMDSSSYFNPYDSFLKVRFRLYKRVGGVDTPLERSDNIAPSMFFCDNLFQQISMNINNESISQVSDYVPHIAALDKRMNLPEPQMNNYEQQTNFSQAYLNDRIVDLTNDSSYADTFEYQIFENQLGDVSIANANGGYIITSIETNLSPGDVIVLDNKTEYTVLSVSVNPGPNTTTGTVHPYPPVDIVSSSLDTWTSYRKRKTSNQFKTRGINSYEAIWKPSIGFFKIDDFIPGCSGLFNLQLTPHPDGVYQKTAIETGVAAGVTHGSPTALDADYVLSIETINLYLKKGIGTPVTSKQLALNIMEIRCQSQNLTTTSNHQKTFQVHPKSRALTLAYQYSGAGISTNRYIASKFRANGNDELKLTRFWIDYAGKQLPTPIPDVLYDTTTSSANARDYFVQRYVESMRYGMGFESGEPLLKWFERGPYYHFSGYDPDMLSDRATITSQFSGANFTDSIRPNILLFDHFMKKIVINIDGSIIKNVSVT